MMKAVVGQDGCAVLVERPIPTCDDASRQVVIKVAATALNRADLMQVAGKYPPPPGVTDVLGLECSGVVHQVSDGCLLGFKVGDRVAALLAGGGYGEYVCTDERTIVKLPEEMSFQDGVATTETWLTAFQLLKLVANVNANDSILIHAGASGVGIAAIQIARNLGVENIYVTAGSERKIKFCKELGAKEGINYKEQDWSTMLEGKIDVVFDCIGFPYVEGNLKCLKVDGTWVLYGFMGGITDAPAVLGPILRKRISLLGTTLRARSDDYKQSLIREFHEFADPLFKTGVLTPFVDRVFQGLDSAQEAQDYMRSNSSMGKIVLLVSNL